MKQRWNRRWSYFTMEDVQKLADLTPVEKYSQCGLAGLYTPPFTEKLVGKELKLVMDQGRNLTYKFLDKHSLTWTEEEEEHQEFYQALELPGAEGLFLVQHYCKGSVPPTAHMLVLDFDNGLTTICEAHAGVPAAPREMDRAFCFGRMEGYEDTGIRHGFTEELVGKSIYWTYHEEPLFRVKHIYTAPLYYTYQMTNDAGDCWVASNPANYLKIRENVYVFSFVEERQAGTQGFFLINMENLHDVGSFFGIQAHGMESCMVGAKGELSEPYAWDWCENR